ncbi:uncharacterized protein C8Q71DRAFT_402640 [Rhodofomes roseus]|uniref:Transmembrane protein n=1 Tax=Rhodofomes roseus TaxID=34475 RepID=A0ABQ8JZ61_9APHY|nr:uncharacterized protein C8Q71DRAFT_402640 [Rhodofomes roseus]KAH9829587.1 hypothetical protein C8Q71DRAFT_402640 [Rhodofomes roseus]
MAAPFSGCSLMPSTTSRFTQGTYALGSPMWAPAQISTTTEFETNRALDATPDSFSSASLAIVKSGSEIVAWHINRVRPTQSSRGVLLGGVVLDSTSPPDAPTTSRASISEKARIFYATMTSDGETVVVTAFVPSSTLPPAIPQDAPAPLDTTRITQRTVGVTLGALLFMGLGCLLWRCRRRRRRQRWNQCLTARSDTRHIIRRVSGTKTFTEDASPMDLESHSGADLELAESPALQTATDAKISHPPNANLVVDENCPDNRNAGLGLPDNVLPLHTTVTEDVWSGPIRSTAQDAPSVAYATFLPHTRSSITPPPSFRTHPSAASVRTSYDQHVDSGFRFHPGGESQAPEPRRRVVDLPPAYTED